MATPRDVPWLEIRRTWEASALGDAALASRFGFASKTTIKRRRLAEGWTRDETAIAASVTAQAIAVVNAVPAVPPKAGGGAVPPGHTQGTPGAQPENEQLQGSDTRTDVGVPPKAGGGTSLSRQPVVHAREIVDHAADWQAEVVAAKVRQLRLARKMQDVSAKVLSAIEGVLDGPMLGGPYEPGEDLFGPNTPYGLAIISLRALNPDKDSLSTILKAASETMHKGVELERKALSMDDGAPEAAGQGDRPSGIMSEEEFIALYSDRTEALEALADASREISRIGARRSPAPPTIDVPAERVK